MEEQGAFLDECLVSNLAGQVWRQCELLMAAGGWAGNGQTWVANETMDCDKVNGKVQRGKRGKTKQRNLRTNRPVGVSGSQGKEVLQL